MQHKDCQRYDFDILFTYIYETRWLGYIINITDTCTNISEITKSGNVQAKKYIKFTFLD